ncbi:hypothetical protein GCM10012282_61060 [Streptomyces lacrimifluminis]|uniref:Uncharacterized protein n=1 Tax=Streptomyces lacrimifluminis TaxID=1500077 RepID=A0A917LAJ8_9ACTN|nr:hypothetical protein GCM10012282_61060 [Streptomyces lacrimifluminis]
MLFATPDPALTITSPPLTDTPVAALAGPAVKVTAEPAITATIRTRSNAFLPIDFPSVAHAW